MVFFFTKMIGSFEGPSEKAITARFRQMHEFSVIKLQEMKIHTTRDLKVEGCLNTLYAVREFPIACKKYRAILLRHLSTPIFGDQCIGQF